MTDDLFTPTIKDAEVPTERPWNPDSIVYPAFFGGPLAGAALGFLNGRKLLLSRTHLLLIVLAGVAGFALRAVLAVSMGPNPTRSITAAVAGILVWLVVVALQRKAFRAAIQNESVTVKSMVGPGFAALFAFGILENIIIYGVLS